MYYNYWDTLVSFVLPLIVIVILNSFTAYTVWKVARVRRSMTYKRYDINILPQNQIIVNLNVCMKILDNRNGSGRDWTR